jgi:3-dehydroquinate synthase
MQNKFDSLSLTISSSSHDYAVQIGSGIFANYMEKFDGFVLADQRFESIVTQTGLKKVVFVEALEDNKVLSTVESVLIALKNLGMTRDDVLVAVGGGIIQDIATIAASLYMRGVAWSYFPTTLLGMTDSCIGGKSSINAGVVKNLVGNIYPPDEILIDVDFLATLNQIDIHAGLAEAAKIAFCSGPDAFKTYLELAADNPHTDYVELLFFVLSQKKWFIEIDEFDRAERKLLNFGHTFGHALESATNHEIPHGIAVALGIRAAVSFIASKREVGTIESQLDEYMRELSYCGLDYGSLLQRIDWDKFSSAFSGDKKHSSESYKLITPLQDGGVEIGSFPKNAELIEEVKLAQLNVLEEMAI